jgi:hypothetical protein
LNNQYSSKEEKNDNNNKKPLQSNDIIGVDSDEQVMNGSYGMLETVFEDSKGHENGN